MDINNNRERKKMSYLLATDASIIQSKLNIFSLSFFYLGDFGVVSITPAADSNVEEAGVVLFWSPELVQRKIVNRKIDIWALGIVILEILNGGKAPYEDERLNEDEVRLFLFTSLF